MKVVVVGGGAREHALALVLGRTADVIVTPGNGGIPGSTPVPAIELDADLFVIGPEAPLSAGLADELRAQGKRVFGPGVDGARLETSKAFMKDLLAEAGVPTARYASFTEIEPAVAFLESLPGLYVVKTDYLAAGKGVLVTETLAEAAEDAREKLEGGPIVIEEGLSGPELSVFVVCDGARSVGLPPARDYKRLLDGDAGPNTGGMGSFSPVPDAPFDEIMATHVEPTVAALRARGIDYRGALYAGLMLTPEGPKMLEYNVRFGDPDSQVVLLRHRGDLAEELRQAADGALTDAMRFDDTSAVSVVVAADEAGVPVGGLDEAETVDGVAVLHYRTERDGRGGHRISGTGRALCVTAVRPSVPEARDAAYEALKHISFEGMFYRTDIGGGVR